MISVNEDGVATANVATGSSSLTATIGGVTSRPLLMSVARTAENALVVSDAQITTAPVLVAGGAEGSALGARYTVTLQDVGQPQPGQVLLATGERPISGRVISTHPSRAGTVVTLETVPLTALYRDLDVSERVRVDAASLVPLSGPQAPEQVQRHADGSVTLTYRLPKSTKDGSPMTTQSEPLPGTPTPSSPDLSRNRSLMSGRSRAAAPSTCCCPAISSASSSNRNSTWISPRTS
ncbi:hypothetical protein ACFSC4_20720 [Deinococcus malanensis]|uniref:hypothetical protein n=1 Tax=Deinococcus malanensis TaxID=1706855 RepID=UPI003632F14A